MYILKIHYAKKIARQAERFIEGECPHLNEPNPLSAGHKPQKALTLPGG